MADTLLLTTSTLLLIIGIVIMYKLFTQKVCNDTISYKYLPRTFQEEQSQPLSVSALYKDMFLKDTTRVRS